ncbi:MAG: serine hydrolase domain-containing protein [Thermoanaerobaculia bacterium]
MKHLLASLCVSALALIEAVSGTASQVASGGDINFSDIDRYVSQRMGSARIPGLAVAIVKGDRIVYLQGYGVADSSGRLVTAHTPFLIGSITKSFTALSTMQLVEAGKVDLDALVQRYVPWFRVADPQASARITVRHLLTMTSGLPQIYETQPRRAASRGPAPAPVDGRELFAPDLPTVARA